jgi:hypothetical protein
MSGKIYLNSSIKFIPQKDFAVQQTENGGIEATQTFLCRYNSLGTSDLTPFNRGNRLDTLWPECPSIYRGLRVKTAVPNHHEASGIWEIKVVFTGTLFAWSTSGGSSGAEQTVPTYSLQGNFEEPSITSHPKFIALDAESKYYLSELINGRASTDSNYDTIYSKDFAGEDVETELSGDAITICKIIAEGETTYKKPAWTYSVREESSSGFTTSDLDDVGKIVKNPPGNPRKPSGNWTWLKAGPNQEQSGDSRFFKDYNYILIEDNEKNNFLYD